MLNILFIVLTILYVTSAIPQIQPRKIEQLPSTTTPIPIISQFAVKNSDGSFNSSYETGNGIKVQSTGYIKKILIPEKIDKNGRKIAEHEENILVQTGAYSYIAPNGEEITVTYIADENGFQPHGDHLPRPYYDGEIISPDQQENEGFTEKYQTYQPPI